LYFLHCNAVRCDLTRIAIVNLKRNKKQKIQKKILYIITQEANIRPIWSLRLQSGRPDRSIFRLLVNYLFWAVFLKKIEETL
jgi:hypothetical protein